MHMHAYIRAFTHDLHLNIYMHSLGVAALDIMYQVLPY